jgi:hypothetical protein
MYKNRICGTDDRLPMSIVIPTEATWFFLALRFLACPPQAATPGRAAEESDFSLLRTRSNHRNVHSGQLL